MESVRSHFRPEFLNRVDEVALFDFFTTEEFREILKLELAKLEARLGGLQLKIQLTDKATDQLIAKGAGPEAGARGLRRVLEDQIEDAIADMILDDGLAPGSHLVVDVADGEFVFDLASQEELTSQEEKVT